LFGVPTAEDTGGNRPLQTAVREGAGDAGEDGTLRYALRRHDQKQITSNGAANFAPYFTPDGSKIIFASNRTTPTAAISICSSSTATARPEADHI